MFGDTPLVMVEDADTLAQVCQTLSEEAVIAVDTESDSFHHYQEKVCLIQLSGLDADYIVDPLLVPDLAPLKALLEDPDTQKILHGADYDVVCLKRDFDISLHNIFDTMIAGQFLAFPRIGLADLIRHFFSVKLDKKYQRHDWSRRPLLDEHLQYARGDTHWLIAVAEVLTHKLQQTGRLDAAREEWAVLEQREWTGRAAHDSDFLRLKKSNTLDEVGQRVLRALWEYREDQARDMDRPAFKVMPGDTLVHIARRQPEDMDALAECVRAKSSLYRRHGPELVAAVLAGLADERAVPRPPAKGSSGSRSSGSRSSGSQSSGGRSSGGRKIKRSRNDQLLGQLKAWRNDIVDREGIAPVVVANNQLLKEIASHAPQDLAALQAIEGIRDWQVATYGDQLLALVKDATDQQSARPKRRRRRRRRSSDRDPSDSDSDSDISDISDISDSDEP